MAQQETFTDSESGLDWTVRIVFKGDSYGRDDCLTHDEDEPLVEFYDRRYMFVEDRGQFVSRYCMDTLVERDSRYGLNLAGGVPDWSVGAAAMNQIMEWAKGRKS